MPEMKTVAAYTLGCKVNQYETEAVLEQFLRNGYDTVPFDSRADVYLVNTCTVTSLGDRKSRQMIRRTKHLNPEAVLVVMGCYSQTAPEEVLKIKEVDLILGTSDRGRVMELVNEFLNTSSRRSLVGDISAVAEFEELEITHYENRTRAFLKVQDGCNQFCSYCIIPYARGRIRSRSADSAVKEAENLVRCGFSEIVLVGIHLASYGKETGEKNSLADLLHKLSGIDGLKRIRLGSLEPTLFTEDFIAKIKQLPKVCRHFHLSLQSGCDETLRRMNRKYTTLEYASVVNNIRTAMPEAAITTDIMVGFPQESEEEFAATCKFVTEIQLAEAHIFKYSVRKGTRAAAMDGQIPPQEKEQRSKQLASITKKTAHAFLERFLNQEMEVLFEQHYKGRQEQFEGKTGNYITVVVQSTENLEGRLLRVQLTGIDGTVMKGILLSS